MQLRDLGKTGLKVSPLGFGMMRLPMKDGGRTENSTKLDQVDVEESIAMLRHAIDEGLNYVDTAFNYVGGKSEKITGMALADGYREKVILASKSPVWLYKEESDFDSLLAKQLERLQTDRLDMYLLHSINANYWKRVKRYNAVESMKKAKEQGLVKNIGFSFHDDFDLFKEVLDAADWDFCQIQLNYYDENFQAGLEGAKLAAERGIGVVVMEPLRGGFLVDLPDRVQEVFDAAPIKKSNVEWALDYLWNLPEVSVVLSGMSTREQLDQNLEYARKSQVGMLSQEELDTITKAKQAFDSYSVIPCTGCNYCVEYCPSKIAIPYNFHAYNLIELTGSKDKAREFYEKEVMGFGRTAASCTECASCEAICPQHIKISSWMPKIDEELG